MPVYFFHVKHRDAVDDDLEGMSFDDLDQAKSSAAITLREVVAGNLRAARQIDISGIDITDPTGKVVATVTVGDAVISVLGQKIN
jgi:CheY-specific phosphatase CheX